MTLRSISLSAYKNFEVIIVDDASIKMHRIRCLVRQFGFNINVIGIKAKQKKWTNPCIPYNIGFDNAVGDVVLIQNAECVHIGDIISHVANNISDDNYLSYSAYAISEQCTRNVLRIKGSNMMEKIRTHLTPFTRIGPPNKPNSTWMAWLNHPVIRPIGYHWCAAIKKINLEKLNGFDERYSLGIGWDDPDLVRRVKRLGLNIVFFDETNPFVVHLYHKSHHVNWKTQFDKNRILYEQTESEPSYKAVRTNIDLFNHKNI
jgi:glycosyltransferase involved in cell wall biosynthesis